MDGSKSSYGSLELTFRNPFKSKKSPSVSCLCLDPFPPDGVLKLATTRRLDYFTATVTEQLVLDDGLPFSTPESTSEEPSPYEEEPTPATLEDRTVLIDHSRPLLIPGTPRRDNKVGNVVGSIEDHGVVVDGGTDFLKTPKLCE